ncbi:MAG: UDP-N-acetylmuramoyl-tripeptide--D-alanyl-D-alanine ligase [Gammaproteobacteria bacterium]|nr:UDP-N-acetylmuramoyl-tripeptide--D-alanyl-D-alanine ligase [Gammaproteobacteria bacterium]
MSTQLHLSQLATLLACPAPIRDAEITGAIIDSRKAFLGCLFVALDGEHVDGHDYIAAARQAGATAALVSRLQDDELPQLLVADVTKAFGEIAKYWLQQCQTTVIAVTGSNGKTTVKEMIASILRQCGSVVATQGNLNNDLGVPMTLMNVSPSTDYAVIEMGASCRGDISRLVEIAPPQFSVINNIAPAHLEGFGDLMGVAKAKAEIFLGLVEGGVGILNADMDFVNAWTSVLEGKQIRSFALENEADITAHDLQIDATSSHFMVNLDGEFDYINLPLPGKHNVANALAAIAVTSAMNVPASAIVKGLASTSSVPHRLQLRTGVNQSQLIDDSYNANPGSYTQALATLSSFSGKHCLVLGDFGELGAESEQLHRQMGIDAKEAGIQKLWTIGEKSEEASKAYGSGAVHFHTIEALMNTLKTELSSDDICLIKGSRFMQLDKLADALAEGGES